jgi:galactokinase
MASRVVATAPGRVNLIGEHTDYNEGFVLPMVLPLETTVVIQRSEGEEVDVESRERGRASFRLGEERPTGDWIDYVSGATALLRSRGAPLGPVRIQIRSAVPLGSGLSSSASLLVALLRGFRSLFDMAIDDVGIAQLARAIENEFVGARVGIMDPLVVSVGAAATALFVDTRSLAYEHVLLPPGIRFVVLDSGVAHRLSGGGYNRRRDECEEAARLLGVASLRDVDADALLEDLPETLRRRVRHVVTENARVLAAREALLRDEPERLGALFSKSHASLRDDFEVSVPAVDRLVEIAEDSLHVLGARITGGGFGGAVVAAVRPGSEPSAVAIAERYERETGRRADVLFPRI